MAPPAYQFLAGGIVLAFSVVIASILVTEFESASAKTELETANSTNETSNHLIVNPSLHQHS
jgi:hypothetical protein